METAGGAMQPLRRLDDHPLIRLTGAPALYNGRLYVPTSSYEEAGKPPNYACCTFRGSIVALDGRTVVFVEVRSTAAESTARPAASVDGAKQRRLTDLALYYLKQHRLLNQPARFDVLAMSWPEGQHKPTIAHYRNAFEAVGRFQMYS